MDTLTAQQRALLDAKSNLTIDDIYKVIYGKAEWEYFQDQRDKEWFNAGYSYKLSDILNFPVRFKGMLREKENELNQKVLEIVRKELSAIGVEFCSELELQHWMDIYRITYNSPARAKLFNQFFREVYSELEIDFEHVKNFSAQLEAKTEYPLHKVVEKIYFHYRDRSDKRQKVEEAQDL